MSQESLKAAVIIPTKGRDACVRQVLLDLSKQTEKNFEVWVVDQNENPLKELKIERSDIHFHHHPMKALGSHAGRNAAIFRTNARICVFIDDDVRIAPDFVAQHVNKYEKMTSEYAVIAGRVVQPKDKLSEEDMRSKAVLARYNSVLGYPYGNFFGFISGDVDHIHECNFSAKTAILKSIGGFNEEFKGNAYFEGVDLALRIKGAGSKIFYESEIVLEHLQDGSGGNRVNLKAEHFYWYIRNLYLVNSIYMQTCTRGLFFFFSLLFVLLKGLKNCSLSIIISGFRGILAGSGYFLPNAKRFHSSEH